MDTDITLAQELIQTMIDFLENGDISTMVDQEVLNYFTMCQQLEVYHEKFKLKGYYMSYDSTTGIFSLSSSNSNNMNYDLSCLADKLFEKFCQQNSCTDMFKCALHCFIQLYGIDRFTNCVQKFASLKHIYNLETVVNRATGNNFNLEATILMEGYESLAKSPRGRHRIFSLIKELIVDDECAETVVSMFAVEVGLDPRICLEVKKTLLLHLEEKFNFNPDGKIWVKMMKSFGLIDAVNTFEPFLFFLINVIKHFSNSITCDETSDAPRTSSLATFNYTSLIALITKLYRNKNSNQIIINFIFNQCALNSQLWTKVLASCHDLPPIESKPEPYYDFSSIEFVSRPIEWKK